MGGQIGRREGQLLAFISFLAGQYGRLDWSNCRQFLNQRSEQVLRDIADGWPILQAVIGGAWQKQLSPQGNRA